MDPNRLHLNFGAPGGQGNRGYPSDRTYPASNDRVYPTTPSTFPQPIFPSQRGQIQNEYVGGQVPSPSVGGYGGAGGYFGNNQYQTQYAQYQQQNIQSPQSQFAPRQGGFTSPDPTTGLTRQFSNQNLGNNQQRQVSPFGRQPSPNQRPRTGGAAGQAYGNHLMLPPGNNSSPSTPSEGPPEQNVEKYAPNIAKKVFALHVYVDSFFTGSISRTRERNARAKELEQFCNNPKYAEQEKKAKVQKAWLAESEYLRSLRITESPNNFQTVKIVGKGAFGEVKLVTRKTNGQIFALKSLVKSEMFKKDQLAHVRAERDILAQSDSPWVVKLHTSFQDSTFLYMLMEYLPGGDLMTSLIKHEIFPEDVTRFYIAEILLAIEAVHKLGFIHRDIKPDNILMDRDGHIKLTDFGLSTGFHPKHEASYYKQLLKDVANKPKTDNRQSVSLDQINLTVSNRGQVNNWRQSRRRMAYSTVGTPDYIAPEIFGGQGYTYSCDWWSLGAIMFECMIGWPPFCAEEPHDTYRKIVDWQYTLVFPEDIVLNPKAEHIIRSLLCDAPNRLGHEGGPQGASEIKAHPFFAGVLWDSLRTIEAPFKPNLTSALDFSYFPIEDIDQNDHSAAWRAQTQGLNEDHSYEMDLPFIGYTFKRYRQWESDE